MQSVWCGICTRWFHYICEGTLEERVLKEYPKETHYICKKDKEQKPLEAALESSENSYKKRKKNKFLEIQDVPAFYSPIRETKVLKDSFILQSILILEEYLQKW